MISKGLILLSVLGLCYTAVWRSNLPPIPAEFGNKEGCYIKEINDVVPWGQVVKPIGRCVRINCGRDMLHFASCGIVLAGPGCYVTEKDLTKPYPDCCPRIKCTEDNKV